MMAIGPISTIINLFVINQIIFLQHQNGGRIGIVAVTILTINHIDILILPIINDTAIPPQDTIGSNTMRFITQITTIQTNTRWLAVAVTVVTTTITRSHTRIRVTMTLAQPSGTHRAITSRMSRLGKDAIVAQYIAVELVKRWRGTSECRDELIILVNAAGDAGVGVSRGIGGPADWGRGRRGCRWHGKADAIIVTVCGGSSFWMSGSWGFTCIGWIILCC
mmetsp:Transcript_22724/g.40699  ORF Transcript_22724/g.40699 Transcript_22724/m.40699 type:complete len:221 (+) Transcript_22724:1213-1875(+)